VPALLRLRRAALAMRPPLHAFAPARRPLEALLRSLLESPAFAVGDSVPLAGAAAAGRADVDIGIHSSASARAQAARARAHAHVDAHADGFGESDAGRRIDGSGDGDADLRGDGGAEASVLAARRLVTRWNLDAAACRRLGAQLLYRDWWTGELRAAAPPPTGTLSGGPSAHADARPPRSARMSRRPAPRDALPDEDEQRDAAAWMVQPDPPHESAEDPLGMQRPIDRDEELRAEEYGELVSELGAARIVATSQPAREVLLSDDPPPGRMRVDPAAPEEAAELRFRYPEWDAARQAYLEDAVTVHVRTAETGPAAWVEATLARHPGELARVRRQFESLRPERLRLRRQPDGDEPDLDACVQGRAELRRPGRRSLALLLLVDASGSTDGWIGSGRRVIDVEREAALLVGHALEPVGVPFAIAAYSGEGPHGVVLRLLKTFDEAWRDTVALRIGGLEPERYTRTGAALRHATAMLMRAPAERRALVLLSDGKPNDADLYDGRYGLEDTRQSVNEARLQGIVPFCLTVDRQAPAYMPQLFGASGYALLNEPERLPAALLDWTRRLLVQ
jgi:nitric oxide reductase NorD protein